MPTRSDSSDEPRQAGYEVVSRDGTVIRGIGRAWAVAEDALFLPDAPSRPRGGRIVPDSIRGAAEAAGSRVRIEVDLDRRRRVRVASSHRTHVGWLLELPGGTLPFDRTATPAHVVSMLVDAYPNGADGDATSSDDVNEPCDDQDSDTVRVARRAARSRRGSVFEQLVCKLLKRC